MPRDQLYQGGVSDPRNPNLLKIFQLLGLGERAGSGFQRIVRAWREQNWVVPLVSEQVSLEMTEVHYTPDFPGDWWGINRGSHRGSHRRSQKIVAGASGGDEAIRTSRVSRSQARRSLPQRLPAPCTGRRPDRNDHPMQTPQPSTEIPAHGARTCSSEYPKGARRISSVGQRYVGRIRLECIQRSAE